jgi:hypothetical protein
MPLVGTPMPRVTTWDQLSSNWISDVKYVETITSEGKRGTLIIFTHENEALLYQVRPWRYRQFRKVANRVKSIGKAFNRELKNRNLAYQRITDERQVEELRRLVLN